LLKEVWNSFPWYLKILLVVGVPVILLLALTSFGRSILRGFMAARIEKINDGKLNELGKEIDRLTGKSDTIKSNIDQLEKQRAEIKTEENTVDFHNKR